MTDNERHSDTPANTAAELDDTQLDQVAGGEAAATQSTGAGAGKVTFNPFTITKHIDTSSP